MSVENYHLLIIKVFEKFSSKYFSVGKNHANVRNIKKLFSPLRLGSQRVNADDPDFDIFKVIKKMHYQCINDKLLKEKGYIEKLKIPGFIDDDTIKDFN